MNNYKKENNDYFYMLNIIDTFSKFVCVELLKKKKKDAKSVSKVFEKIINKAKTQKHKSPALILTDNCLEFENKRFLKKYEIKMYHTQNEETSALVNDLTECLTERRKFVLKYRIIKNGYILYSRLVDEYNCKNFH
jgi:leucyl aminopeptidase